jgi:CRP-like cAMP-binding protein
MDAIAKSHETRSPRTKPGLASNQLLKLLRDVDDQWTRPLTRLSVEAGTRLHEVNEPIDDVYFPLNAVVCLATVLQNGQTVANAMIGPEGVVGFGRKLSTARSIVQLPGEVVKMPVATLRSAAASVPGFRDMISHFNDVLVAQIQQTAACYASHTIEARLCRWLLSTADKSLAEELQLTQLTLANMLGVHRSSVNEAIAALQARGAVSCRRRGHIRVERERAESLCCECHGRLRLFEKQRRAVS